MYLPQQQRKIIYVWEGQYVVLDTRQPQRNLPLIISFGIETCVLLIIKSTIGRIAVAHIDITDSKIIEHVISSMIKQVNLGLINQALQVTFVGGDFAISAMKNSAERVNLIRNILSKNGINNIEHNFYHRSLPDVLEVITGGIMVYPCLEWLGIAALVSTPAAIGLSIGGIAAYSAAQNFIPACRDKSLSCCVDTRTMQITAKYEKPDEEFAKRMSTQEQIEIRKQRRFNSDKSFYSINPENLKLTKEATG